MELSELSDNDKLLLMCYEVTRPLVLVCLTMKHNLTLILYILFRPAQDHV